MPTAIGLAFKGIGIYLAKHAVIKFFVYVALSVLLQKVTEKLFGAKAGNTSFAGIQTTSRGSLDYRKFVYGEAMVGGTIFYNNVRDENNETLDFNIAYVDHEIEELISFLLDNDVIVASDITWTPPTVNGNSGTGTGIVTKPQFIGLNSENALRISWYPGHSNQPANTLLTDNYGDLGANHRARGIFHALFSLKYNIDTEKVWETGAPQSILALIKGRLIYDPRLDSTNGGSGPHRFTDDTTWEWSDNPALCMADYLMTYMDSDPADDIDWPTVITAADDCDVVVSVPSPPSTQKRFTCNGVFIADENHEAILDNIKQSMAGRLVWTDGKWAMWAGIWIAPTLTFDEGSMKGDLQVQGSAPIAERYNLVRGFYVDPARQHRPVEFFPATNAAFLTRDGNKELPFEMDMRFTNHEYQCQRIAIRKLEQFDNQKTITVPFDARGAKLFAGLEFSVDFPEFSWTGKAFRCISWKPTDQGLFDITAKEDFASRYTDPAVGAYTVRTAAGVIVPAVQAVPPPSVLVASGGAGIIELSWENPPASLFNFVQIYVSTTDDRGTATLLAEQRGDSFTHQVGDIVERFYWLRAKGLGETLSLFEPDTTPGISGTATSAAIAEWEFIKAITGTAIANGIGTLTLEATRSSAGVETLLSAGNIKLFVGSTEVTVANGFATGSDGFTGVFDAGDIGGDVIVLLKDGAGGTVIDSITLLDVIDGSIGGEGLSIIVANVYQRSASAPATPTANDGEYNFTTNVLTPPSGWSVAPPAGADPLYVSTGSFSIVGQTGIDTTVVWTAPDILVQDGADGTDGDDGAAGGDGLSIHVANVYIRSSSAPSTPSANDGEYNFSTNVLTPPSSWSAAPPAGADPLYVSTGSFSITGTTGIDTTVVWTSPDLLVQDGADGATGSTGQRARTVNIYKLNDSTITDDTQGTFASPLSGMEAGWAFAVPALGADGDQVFGSVRTFTDDAASPQDSNWSTPTIYAQRTDGSDGATGGQGDPGEDAQDTRFPSIFRLNSSAINSTSGTFADPLAGNSAWSFNVPALAADGDQVFITTRILTSDAASPQEANWSTPAIYSQRTDGTDGSTGSPGSDGADGDDGNFKDTKFKRATAPPATPTGNNPAGWTDEIPTGTDTVWQIVGLKTAAGVLIGVWSDPAAIQGLVFRGTYSSGTAYIVNDVVTFSERSYINTTAGTGNDPSGTNAANAFWDLLAGKGDTGDPPSAFNETIVIGSQSGPVSLRALANAHTPAYDGIADAIVVYTLAAGVLVTGAAGQAGIDTGVWPSGASIDLTIENEGTIRSGGGTGGKGGNAGNRNGSGGTAGGDAITCQEDLIIDNAPSGSGVIEAAGGGAGGGGGCTTSGGEPVNHGGGGGGGGFPNGAGGAGGTGGGGNGAAGAAGTTGGGGAGGGGSDGGGCIAGDGGNGGNVNVAGGNGAAASGGGANASGGSGGARGFAVRKNGHTVTVTGGTVTGQVG